MQKMQNMWAYLGLKARVQQKFQKDYSRIYTLIFYYVSYILIWFNSILEIQNVFEIL